MYPHRVRPRWPFVVLVVAIALAGCARTIRFQPLPSDAPLPAPAVPPAPTPSIAAPSPVILSPRGGEERGEEAHQGRLIPGEFLRYTILWFGLEVMRGELSVAGTPILYDGRPHLALSASAVSTGLAHHLFSVEDTLSALADPDAVLPAHFEFTLRHGKHRTVERVVFDRLQRRAVSTQHAEPLAIPPDARDLLTTCYYLRTMDVAEGRTLAGEFVAQGRLWPLTATVHRRGILTIPRGTFPAWEVEVQTPWLEPYIHHQTLWLWVSEDAVRVPLMARVKLPFGWLTALLDDCRPANSLAFKRPLPIMGRNGLPDHTVTDRDRVDQP